VTVWGIISGLSQKEVWPKPGLDDEHYLGALRTNDHPEDPPGVSDMQAFARAVDGCTEETFVEVMADGVDLDNLLRYMAVDRAAKNWDGIVTFYHWTRPHNFYWYHEAKPGGIFHLIPWDLDNTFWEFDPVMHPEQWVTADPVPEWNIDNPISGTADLKYNFEFTRVEGAWNEWTNLYVYTEAEQAFDLSAYTEISIAMKADTDRSVRVRALSPVYEEAFGGAWSEFGTDIRVTDTPTVYKIRLAGLTYPGGSTASCSAPLPPPMGTARCSTPSRPGSFKSTTSTFDSPSVQERFSSARPRRRRRWPAWRARGSGPPPRAWPGRRWLWAFPHRPPRPFPEGI
jgi:hypothetical protein